MRERRENIHDVFVLPDELEQIPTSPDILQLIVDSIPCAFRASHCVCVLPLIE